MILLWIWLNNLINLSFKKLNKFCWIIVSREKLSAHLCVSYLINKKGKGNFFFFFIYGYILIKIILDREVLPGIKIISYLFQN